MKALLRRYGADRAGAAAIEYVLLGSIVAIAIIAGATALNVSLDRTYQEAVSTYGTGIAGGGAAAVPPAGG